MSQSTLCITMVLAAVTVSHGYPVNVTNCGVMNTYSAAPTRAITMNQGATEFMLAMGLEGSMVGTAYLDDSIWPQYAAAYATIPVLASSYPTEDEIMAVNPDFIVASYSSAFRAQYTTNRLRGIFSNATVAPCTGNGSEWPTASSVWTTCRPQLHDANIGTYLFEDACEDSSLRPTTVTEDTVYEEMQALGAIFGVNTQALIDDMRADFDQAAGLVSSGMSGAPLNAVWLDCVGCCSSSPYEQVLLGAGTGAPNMLMQEAGLANVFANTPGNWACVNVSSIIAANPDVLVVVDASWDSAIEKIRYLYNAASFCQLEVLRAARFVSIPFSATTLSPRNGPAALDLARAALHVRTGSVTAAGQSGVSSFSPYFLQSETACTLCPLQMSYVVYDDATDSATNYNNLCTTTASNDDATTLGSGSDSSIESSDAKRLMFSVFSVASFLFPSLVF